MRGGNLTAAQTRHVTHSTGSKSVYFLATLLGGWADSQPLDHQGSPVNVLEEWFRASPCTEFGVGSHSQLPFCLKLSR